MNVKKKILYGILAVFCICTVVIFIYLNDYYHTDTEAVAAFNKNYELSGNESDGIIAYVPENPLAAFVFYPGGKVEYTAYEALMLACAERGILCVLVEMPFNLAVFDIDAAAEIKDLFPEIESWYIGGHSLGGSMAAGYLADSSESYEGLVLLGSYSASDLSDTEIRTLSIYGSEDRIMNRDKYNESLQMLSDDFTEFVIEGANHAQFGMYGEQDGDGKATISNEEQIRISSELIADFILDN